MDGYSDDAFSEEESAEVSVISVGSAQHSPHPPAKKKPKQKSKHLVSRQSKYVSPYSLRPAAPIPPRDKSKIPTSSKLGTAAGKTAREQWLSALRGNKGMSSESMGTNTWHGVKPRPSSSNTSAFLHELLLGSGKPRMGQPRAHSASVPHTRPGSAPSYKPKEDMYDEIQELKKLIQTQKEEKSHLVTRIRRLEEDGRKKDKKIEDMMSSGRVAASDFTRSLADRKSDSSAAVTSVKHQVYTLEKALKERDSQYNKLLRDMKTTDLEELKLQLEMYRQEVLRLRQANADQDVPDGLPPSASRDMKVKVKALNTAVRRLSETNKQLESENKSLKEDLERAMSGTVNSVKSTDRKRSKDWSHKNSTADKYADHSRSQMVARLVELEMEVDTLNSRVLTSNSQATATDSHHKQTLQEVTTSPDLLQQRINELESNEQELLAERDKLRNVVRKLKEDRAHYRNVAETTQSDLVAVRGDLHQISDTHSATQKELLYLQQREDDERKAREHAAKLGRRRKTVKPGGDKQHEAAAVLQTNWRKFHSKKRQEKYEEDYSEAATTIQSALRGHISRKQRLEADRTSPPPDDEELDDASTIIQSAARAHWTRQRATKESKKSETKDWKRSDDRSEPKWNTVGDSDTNEIRKSFEREFLNSTSQHDNNSAASSASYSVRDDQNSELASENVKSTRSWQTASSKLEEIPVKVTKKRVVKKSLMAANEVTSMSPSPWIHDSDEEEAPDGDSKPSKALLDEFW